GGSGRGTGGGPSWWRNVKAYINALPSNVLVWTIIGLNGAVFLMWQYASSSLQNFRDPRMLQWMFKNFTTSWENLRQGIWTLLTSAFSHNSTGHVLMNLMTFYFFAPMGAAVLGNVPFLGLYLGGAIASSVISILWNQRWKQGRPLPSHGASGGINAVLAFFACAFPRATIYLFFIVPLPAWAAIGGLIGWDFYSAVVQRKGSMVDSAGHLGGALGGALFFLRWRMGRRIF
ncbi:rhomboid-domain-containing protein, partial [Clavulina sp. PMI_390]